MAGQDPARSAGVVAPPPLIYLAALLLGLGLDRLLGLPGLGLGSGLRLALAAACGLVGLALAAPALLGFRRAGTQVEPWKPSSALVTGGPYRWTRNPMYLGLTLVYLAAALVAGSAAALVLLAPLLLVVRYGVIGREERYLEALFGQPYRDYKARVRRWF
ncbi:Protein-S-isoprenylcysteine O-methyltransferase Ste14 [Tistlia consotensis]|uniref:Protein-S-isoprenylcysteine O-methyltransferase Ste14 n=1 Tax=Tistlia consotensis USBA 355 TaxID=560819 RepID=A0A1Y6BNJ9_9PROT|nr:isoprenylcysteine carboxylmethyltransferase family protein [Tistlia consotensis]SMF12843.1 Protein-S-isoprenylcysteine O-methyltransferase Ste14 [Tistlia consotensis USBA 355]SNR50883.1 Protein-S-isoprenylcysteine O-methyltransferase Ste14 [Tistlia consotensis]